MNSDRLTYMVWERIGTDNWVPITVNGRFDSLTDARARRNRCAACNPKSEFRVVREHVTYDVMMN